MPVLSGLPGTDGKERQCVFVRSVSATLKVLRSGVAAIAAKENGCFHVWRDDDGNYRCESQRYMVTQDSQTFPFIKDIKPWVKVWLEKIQ